MKNERRLNIREAALYLAVSEVTVRREIKRGNLAAYRPGLNGQYMFSEEDLHKYILRHTHTIQSAHAQAA